MTYVGYMDELPIGQDGLNGADNMALVLPNQLTDALNISFASGAITRDGGGTYLNGTTLSGSPTVIGGWDWWPTSSAQRTVVLTSDGKAYKDTGGGTFGVTLATGKLWTTSSIPVFVEGGKELAANNVKLFIFTGLEQVQVLSADGATTGNIGANKPVDWGTAFPYCGANHEGRLWGGGNSSQPHRAYYSTVTDYEDFTSAGAGTINVFPGEGQRIVAMCSFKGLLVIWKYPRGIYYVDTTDPTTTNWRVVRVASQIGAAGPRAWCYVDSDILFMDANGSFHTLGGVQEFGDLTSGSISPRVWFDQWMSRNINPAQLPKVRAVYYPAKREAHFALAGTGAQTNNRRVIWDFNSEAPRARYNDFPTCEELFVRQDTNAIARPAAGDNAGFVWLLDQVNRNAAGAAYTSTWKSAQLELHTRSSGGSQAHLGQAQPGEPQLSFRRKNGKFLELVITPYGNWNMSVSTFWDDALQETLTFNLGGGGGVLVATVGDANAFILDTDVLAGGRTLNRKRRIIGSGKRFAVSGTHAGINEDFAISKFLLYYTGGGDLEG